MALSRPDFLTGQWDFSCLKRLEVSPNPLSQYLHLYILPTPAIEEYDTTAIDWERTLLEFKIRFA